MYNKTPNAKHINGKFMDIKKRSDDKGFDGYFLKLQADGTFNTFGPYRYKIPAKNIELFSQGVTT